MVKKTLNIMMTTFLKGCSISIKILLFIGLFIWFSMDFMMVFFSPVPIWILYAIVIIGCLLSLLGTMFSKIRKKSYISFLIFSCTYLGMFFYAPPVVEQRNADKCLDSGYGVWDYHEHRCRTDCVTWNKEQGCVKE